VLTAGQVHDSAQLEPVLDAIRVPRAGPGRPRKRPDVVLADKGSTYRRCRRALRRRKLRHVIPQRRDQRKQRRARGSEGGRPPGFDRAAYRRRGIATRYEKRALNYRAMVVIGALRLWLTP
jgi:hypothetical protein